MGVKTTGERRKGEREDGRLKFTLLSALSFLLLSLPFFPPLLLLLITVFFLLSPGVAV